MSRFLQLARCAALGLSIAIGLPLAAHAADGVKEFPDKARIVSIGGSITEIVYALGEQDRLVARDSTSTYPAAARQLPDVGYMRQLSPEGVLSVNPTGILALQGSGPAETVDVLKKADIAYIEVPESFDHQGILGKVRAVGAALGVDDKAEALAGELDSELKAAEDLTAGIGKRKRVLFILSVQGGKVMASGSGTAANGIIQLAGGVNAIDGFSGYKQLSDEAIITAKPDLILMMDHAGPAVPDDALFANAAIAATPAGAERRILRMDGSYLLGFGPRTAGAIHDLAVALYGDELAN
jgi:iron complex transport system substrate-binding protein